AGVIRADGRTVLWLAVHHLVADLWSLGILLREWEALYLEEATGRPARLAPPPALGFPDFVRRQQKQLAGPEGERLWRFWRERLAPPLPVLELPTDRPRPPVQTHRGDSVAERWTAAVAEAVRGMGRSRGATLYASLLAGFSVLLHRYTGQEDLLLGSPTTGRSSAELAGVVGYFIDPVVVRADASGDVSFENLLERTRATFLEAFEHTGYPFPLLAERLQPERDPSRSPVFQVFFVLERARQLHDRGFSAFALGEAGARMEWAGLRLTSLPLPRRSAQFDLMMLIAELPDGELALSLEYNADLFDAGTVRRMLGHFRTLIESAAAEPGKPLGMLPLLTLAEREQLLGSPIVPGGQPATLVERFEDWVRRRPNAVAVVHEIEELTYAELDAKAERLARTLRRRGVGPDVLVGLSVERSLDLVVGILGILKAGGAYVPLDPAYPRERLDFMVADAGLTLVVDGREDGGDGDTVRIQPVLENLAYVIYTSGSTGRPKGVMVTHGNAARLFDALAGPLGLGSGDVWTLFHSYAFDFSVWEIWGALALGGRLVIVPYRTSRSPEKLHELLATEGVTVLSQTPSAFRQLVAAEEEMGPAGRALRKVIFGGEALDLAALRPWFARHGDSVPELWNLYGITETTVHVTLRRITPADAVAGGPSRIGRPMVDLAIYLLDRRLEPVPEGVPGEIWVGGAGLARGYLGRPDLTAERFRPDPWSGLPGERLYKSGDLARWRSGDLEFLGRADHQVKVRGHRIEPGEVEAALAGHPAVAQAVVGVKEHGPGDRRLVAWVVLRGKAGPAELRDFLRERLPDPLVPSALLIVPELPLTPSGKVDRGALERLEMAGETLQEKISVVTPRTSTEAALAEIWADLLGVEVGSVEDGFFDLGGHSLLATQMLSRVRSALGVELPIAAVFEAPTVAGLAAAVEAARGGTDQVSPVPPIRPARRGETLPLSFAQQRLWFLHQLDPDVPAYNVPAVFRLRGELQILALARALQGILDRHEALRAGFSAMEGRPVQTVRSGLTIALPVIDLASLPESAREAERSRIAQAEAWTPFGLDDPPLCRVRLLRLGERDHALLAVLHHI
ncbi:MAG TPA: amino acid adenylation domain-containing protein, partial [Thermoanaerobaculia bacterium]|nr:amino acid adenylation domain-containing protein [Thermoanaerobaculia bacterium]